MRKYADDHCDTRDDGLGSEIVLQLQEVLVMNYDPLANPYGEKTNRHYTEICNAPCAILIFKMYAQ